MPKASIIIPAYNAEEYIGKTLDSILAQTFSDFECIVIDDGSTDDTVEVIKGYQDQRIVLIQQPNSGGPAKPRNTGLKQSVGDYIFMFDSDDIMLPHKLEVSVNAMDQCRQADMLFSNFASIDESGKTICHNFLESYVELWNLCKISYQKDLVVQLPSSELYPALIDVNFIGTSSVVLRRKALSQRNLFDESLKNSDDRLFWIQFSQSHNAIFVNDVLHEYRIRAGSISNQGFIRRGPSKIRALQIVKSECKDSQLKGRLDQQIANDYISLGYAYRGAADFRRQRGCALQALKVKFSAQALKLFIQGVLRLDIKVAK
jgi:glycosyltransferase involved in cell wall biosynthesis